MSVYYGNYPEWQNQRYRSGDIVGYDDRLWFSIHNSNREIPGTSDRWAHYTEEGIPIRPDDLDEYGNILWFSGASYLVDSIRRHNDDLWRVTKTTYGTPGVSADWELYKNASMLPPEDGDPTFDFALGAYYWFPEITYDMHDRVSHNDILWISINTNNKNKEPAEGNWWTAYSLEDDPDPYVGIWSDEKIWTDAYIWRELEE